MLSFSLCNARGKTPLVLTCEHASCAVPVDYDDLGLQSEQLTEHIGWDIGAREASEGVAEYLDATAVLAGVSRLIVDCNRDLADEGLIVTESDGVRIPGNARVDRYERERRIRDFYEPYHDAIDAVLAERGKPLLLSLHSFTPVLNGRERQFDIGVLFDTCAAEAQELACGLAKEGLRVRYNEPYSGLDGLIFSARTHGLKYGLRYVELEINNRLLRTRADVSRIAAAVAQSLAPQVKC